MSERLRSVGLDVGTTSTQMVLSELTIENRASQFAVPELEITERKILYKSPIYFTPLIDESRVDGDAIGKIVEAEYAKAGICPSDVDTGAIIITGETSRKENARAVLDALAEYAGDFVVATAGPDLESVLAAKGAGAVAYSRENGKTVLHMDIGGGTSNLALIKDGKILRTGCLNVGGRLIKLDKNGYITYISPVLAKETDHKVGDLLTQSAAEEISRLLAQVLEMAAGFRRQTDLLTRFLTEEAGSVWVPPQDVVPSFSGGVADCIGGEHPWLAFGDLGPMLGRAIRESALCRGEYVLGRETIRATVIGAGSYSTQLSGSTVYYQNVQFPLKNMPVADVAGAEEILTALARQEGTAVLSMAGSEAPDYHQVVSLAESIIAWNTGPYLICLEQDMAKALGQALALRLPPESQILCIDRVKVREGSFLDIGAPLGGALPVVVKTLVLGAEAKEKDGGTV